MILALHLIFFFILDRNLVKANCTENRVCTSCDTVVLVQSIKRSQIFRLFEGLYPGLQAGDAGVDAGDVLHEPLVDGAQQLLVARQARGELRLRHVQLLQRATELTRWGEGG